MTARPPGAALARTLLVAAALLAGAAAARAPAAEGAHPWSSLLPSPPIPDALPPLTITLVDALDLSATLRGAPVRAEVGASLRARYRLDASDYLQRKRADAEDLRLLHGALHELAHRDEVLAWLARRCEGVWRAWQVALVAPAGRPALPDPLGPPPRPAPDAESAYLAALQAVLELTASTPATAVEVGACRLDDRTRALMPAPHAPAAVAAESEARLTARAAALASSASPASAWLEVDAFGSRGGPPAVSLRAGLDLPLPGSGSDLALSLGAAGPQATLSVRAPSLDDRITDRHRDEAAAARNGRPAPVAEAFRRAQAEATLMRAAANARWSGTCGGAEAGSVVACLARAGGSPGVRDALLGAIEAELAALHAELALIAASGHEPAGLLLRPAPARERSAR